MSRKGSLNLSINAIVVLIMAVTLLSLGLTFINRTFGGATDQLQKSLDGINEDRRTQLLEKCSADACLESTSMELSRNDEETNLLVINNKLDCEVDVGIEPGKCDAIESSADCDADIKLEYFSSEQVGPKEKTIIPIIITPRNSAESTTYRLRFNVYGECDKSGGEEGVLDQTLRLDINVG